jgi:pimeloyl-ACP methyl ester carboxylesterase
MTKPILLSYGELDSIVSLNMGKHISLLAKHAKLSVYPGVGHSPFWEASPRFNRELREFRNSL